MFAPKALALAGGGAAAAAFQRSGRGRVAPDTAQKSPRPIGGGHRSPPKSRGYRSGTHPARVASKRGISASRACRGAAVARPSRASPAFAERCEGRVAEILAAWGFKAAAKARRKSPPQKPAARVMFFYRKSPPQKPTQRTGASSPRHRTKKPAAVGGGHRSPPKSRGRGR